MDNILFFQAKGAGSQTRTVSSCILSVLIGVVGGSIFITEQLSFNLRTAIGSAYSDKPLNANASADDQYSSLSGYLPPVLLTDTTVVVSAVLCLLMIPIVALQVYCYRDNSSPTWYGRYKDTPGVVIFQALMVVTSMAFALHPGTLLQNNLCDVCHLMSFVDAKWVPIFRVSYWFHITPALFISILGPFQFLEPVRKFWSFFIHRQVGRVLMLCAVLHQVGSTMMTFTEFNSEVVLGASAGSSLWWSHHVMMIVLSIWAWTAIVVGWWAIIRTKPDIKLHGEMMHRLGASWLVAVIPGRIIVPLLTPVFGAQWGIHIGSWSTIGLVIVAQEVYLNSSGRFGAKTPQSSLKCPFLRTDASHCPFSGTETTQGSQECPFLMEK